jgi:short-subunit dehydrogenase
MTSKVVIVTGASRGIGLSTAKHLLQKSHKVVLVSRTRPELESLKSQYPSQVEFLAADLTNLDVGVTSSDRRPKPFILGS